MNPPKCKFCMQPSDKHLVGCPMYKTPEQRSKMPENPFESLFGYVFGNNPFDMKGKPSERG